MHSGFEALYREQYAGVLRYVDRRLGGTGAEDIAASTFELALRKLPERHPHPVGWLFRTAENLVKAEVRRRERERRALRDAEVIGPPVAEDPAVDTLRGILHSLPRGHRDVLQLTYWDGLGAADAGVVLGCSEQAVWKRISRAKKAIRDAWPRDRDATTWEEAMTRA